MDAIEVAQMIMKRFDLGPDSLKLAHMELLIETNLDAQYRLGRRHAYEAAALIAEGDCLPKCDSIAHEELCPVVNPAKAIRARAREVVGNGKREGL